MDINKFSKTASFEDLGLDSLDSVEAVVAIEDKFKMGWQDAGLARVNDISKIVNI